MLRWLFGVVALVSCGGSSAGPRSAADDPHGRVAASKEEVQAVGQSAKGKLEHEEIKRVIREKAADIRECYLQVIKSKPSARGGVATHFVIGADGSVELAYAEADNDSLPSSMLDCVANGFLLLHFPAPTGGRVLVVYPIEFKNEAAVE
jgi:hypothetical protein